jgi:hypothetical protein
MYPEMEVYSTKSITNGLSCKPVNEGHPMATVVYETCAHLRTPGRDGSSKISLDDHVTRGKIKFLFSSLQQCRV